MRRRRSFSEFREAGVEWLRRRWRLRRFRFGARYHDLRDRAYVAVRRIPYRSLHPNLLIIGAQKAGTTSLHYYLAQHPDVFMTSFKETNLFLDDSEEVGEYHAVEPRFYGSSNRAKRRGLSDDQIRRRMLIGYRGERIVGDASPYYTAAPVTGLEVPARVKAARPDARLVYLVRNPLDRIVSAWRHDRRIHAMFEEPFDEDCDRRIQTRRHYLDMSLYHYQLANYLKHFAREQCRVVVFEDFARDPGAALQEICAFLGLETGFPFDTSLLYRAARRGEARSEARAPASGPRFSEATYERLIGPIREDVARLEAFLDRRLGAWDLSRERWCRHHP
jgi:hypothetical protein